MLVSKVFPCHLVPVMGGFDNKQKSDEKDFLSAAVSTRQLLQKAYAATMLSISSAEIARSSGAAARISKPQLRAETYFLGENSLDVLVKSALCAVFEFQNQLNQQKLSVRLKGAK